MYNKVILVGNLTKDIEIRYSQSGSAIANTGIASTKKFKKQDGSQGEEVLFVDIAAFGRTAEVMNQYTRKGSKVLIEGRLKLEQWNAQDGSKRSKHVVTVESMQMLDSKTQDGNTQQPQPQGQYQQPQQPITQNPRNDLSQQQQAQVPVIDIDETEIPF